jgi:regulator of protease activity HflC (stomatin/prohibitin superfamily)
MDLPAAAFPDFFHLLCQHVPDRLVRKPRKLTPAQLLGTLCLMTGFGRKGYRRVVSELKAGLHHAFGWSGLSLVPSPQAIGQARRSLSRSVCDLALGAIADNCHALAAKPVVRYGAYRLLAIDGTRLSLPPSPALSAAFGHPSNQRGSAACPMAGLVQIWDVGRNCPVAFSLTACDYSERDEGLGLFGRLGRGDVLIGDRGYPGHAFVLAICRRRARFLLRMPARMAVVADFLSSGAADAVVMWRLTNHHGLPTAAPAIPVRLIRTTLPNGTTEVLATNLWQQRGHDCATLIELYTQRWRIETAFREMKVFHALEQFSATYPDGIYQEIVAIQIFLLLTSELEAIARQATAGRQRRAGRAALASDSDTASTQTTPLMMEDVRFNRLIIADNVVHLLRHAALGGQNAIARELPEIIDFLWKNRSYARPGRSFPRTRKRAIGHYRPSGE